MANNIEQKNNHTDPYSNRLHQHTFIQEISLGDFLKRNNTIYKIVAISKESYPPVVEYQKVKYYSHRNKDGEIIERYDLCHELGILSHLCLRRVKGKVVAFTHTENELVRIEPKRKKTEVSSSR